MYSVIGHGIIASHWAQPFLLCLYHKHLPGLITIQNDDQNVWFEMCFFFSKFVTLILSKWGTFVNVYFLKYYTQNVFRSHSSEPHVLIISITVVIRPDKCLRCTAFWMAVGWFEDLRGKQQSNPEPIWSPDFQSPTLCPPGQTIHIKWIPLDKWSKTNSVPMDKWSPINSVPIFPNPYRLSPWTNEIF